MDTAKHIVVVFILVLAGRAYCLQCFQCSASAPDSDCETDVDALADQRENGGPYNKNCSLEHQNYCVIELSHNRGKLTTFIRDCSDGVTFSIDKIPPLQNPFPFNQTRCATFGTSGTVVCLTLCRTDFCNGPQNSGSVSCADSPTTWRVVLFVLMWLRSRLL